MRKIVTFLLAGLLAGSGLVATGCARRTAYQKKTRSYQRQHKAGGRIPCPTHDC